MNKYIVVLVGIIFFASCSSSKRVVTTKSPSKKSNTHTTKKPIPSRGDKSVSSSSGDEVVVLASVTNKIISKALSYKGTKYKYGGTSKNGMDCSGLMFMSFKSAGVALPRTSTTQSKTGVRISKSKVMKGDLVFFKTGGKRSINHVGLVVSIDNRDVKFVHSSSSRGVMISSLREGYWSNAFAQIRRINALNDVREIGVSSRVDSPSSYIVKRGDTLYAIARKYSGVSASNIMSYNKLSSTSLSPGMVLKIPGNR